MGCLEFYVRGINTMRSSRDFSPVGLMNMRHKALTDQIRSCLAEVTAVGIIDEGYLFGALQPLSVRLRTGGVQTD